MESRICNDRNDTALRNLIKRLESFRGFVQGTVQQFSESHKEIGKYYLSPCSDPISTNLIKRLESKALEDYVKNEYSQNLIKRLESRFTISCSLITNCSESHKEIGKIDSEVHRDIRSRNLIKRLERASKRL